MTLVGHIVGTKGNTGRGIASIVENNDYTITINLTDGTSYTTAPIAGFTEIEFDENYDLVVTKTDGTTETVPTGIEEFRDELESIESDAESAKTDAQTAQGLAETAQGKAEDAQIAAETAQGLAETAQGLAETAQGKAQTAQTGAETARSGAETAQGKAEDAQTAAETAQSNAEGYASNASASATAASGSATSASSSATTAINKAAEATTKANESAASALVSEGYANGKQNGTPVSSGTYFENNAKYFAEQASDFADDAQDSADAAAASAASLVIEDALDEDSTNAVENGVITKEFAKKANIDGYYDTLGAGTAEQLTSNIYEEDNAPYNFRTSGGSIDIGDRETDMLVGGTVVWNQLVHDGNFTDTSKWNNSNGTSVSFSENVATITITGSNDNRPNLTPKTIYYPQEPIIGHKYLLQADVKKHSSTGISLSLLYGMNNAFGVINTNDSWLTKTKIINCTATSYVAGTLYISEYISAFSEGDYIQYKNNCIYDLTQMFGSTIADYIYSLEQATEGAGVAWFRRLFPKPYYAYNIVELMSVNASSHDMVGFNTWDEEWENGYLGNSGDFVADANSICSKNFVPIKQPATYYAIAPSGKSLRVCSYDANKNFISLQSIANQTFTLPIGTAFIKFSCYNYGTTYKNDICINLSWDGERDGEYEPYVKHSYPLDSSLTLRGMPKLDNGKLYYDGDTYASDGTVTRKYGIVDLGTMTWTIYNGKFSGTGIINNNCYRGQTGLSTIICEKYETGHFGGSASQGDKKIWLSSSTSSFTLWVEDSSYENATAFKTAMSGVYLVYELATPTTETADPYTNPQIVNDFGTEEYVDYAYSQGLRDVAMPVGHETQYMANLKAKLEMSPNSPNGAGDYIVRQTNGENEYVSLASNATIQNIIARLEALEGGGE